MSQPLLYLPAVSRALSAERLGAYRYRGDDDVGAVSTYLWSMRLCETLYPALHGLEVALRNSLFNAGQQRFAGVACRDVPCWLDAHPPILAPDEWSRVQEAKARLRGRGKPLDPPHLVAELTFGFWTALLDVRYEHRQVLWPRLLSAVFPAIPPQLRKRKVISGRLNRVRLLRNRAFYHEPIWHWGNLKAQHAEIRELLAWIDPSFDATVSLVDRFPETYAAGRSAFRAEVAELQAERDGKVRVVRIAPASPPETN
ncbi:MAG TPA: hypothetical protein VF092_03265 [Longimicrobium sp.]